MSPISWGDTWQMIYREAKGNNLGVNVTKGQLLSSYPIKIKADAYSTAQFTVAGGLAYVPVTFTGLCNYRDFTLQRQDATDPSKWIDIDQSVHGNDFWQTDYDANSGRWDITYNINLDSTNDVRTTVGFRLVPGTGILAGDLDCSCKVDFSDLALFVVDWLEQDQILYSDIDMNRKVDLQDIAVLAGNWLKQK